MNLSYTINFCENKKNLIEINNKLITSLITVLEKAALSKLNQLHAGRKSIYTVKNLKWHDTSFMVSPFVQRNNENKDNDIAIRSYNKLHASENTCTETETEKKTSSEMDRDDWFINEYEKELKNENSKLQQQQVIQLIEELEHMYQVYLKKKQEIKEITDKKDKEKIQNKIENQQQLLEIQWKQLKQYQQQPQDDMVIKQALWDIMKFEKNQQIISNSIWQIKMKETKLHFKKCNNNGNNNYKKKKIKKKNKVQLIIQIATLLAIATKCKQTEL